MRLSELQLAIAQGLSLPSEPFYVSKFTYERARNGSTLFPEPFLIWNKVILRRCDQLQDHDASVYYFDDLTWSLLPLTQFKQIEVAAA